MQLIIQTKVQDHKRCTNVHIPENDKLYLINPVSKFVEYYMQLIIQTKVQDHKSVRRTYSREYRQFLLYRGFCFYCGIDVSRNRFKHFMQSEHRDKVGSFLHVTRIIWLYRLHIIRSSKVLKSTFCFKNQCKRFNLICDRH